tara:strand:- start:628 stop:1899 length:1272 start_codon:yes stop_codon:yes gene_type:complete
MKIMENKTDMSQKINNIMSKKLSSMDLSDVQCLNQHSVVEDNDLRNSSVTTNQVTGRELRNNSVTKSAEMCNNSVTLRNNSVTKAPELRNNSVTNSVTSSVTTSDRFRNSHKKINSTEKTSLYGLSGIAKKIIFYLGTICYKNGTRISPPISFSELKSNLKISTNEVVRVNIHRLINKGFIRKIEHKTGKGGYQILEIREHIYTQLVEQLSKIITSKTSPISTNSVTDSVTNSVTNHPYSSSNNNIYTTTNTDTDIENWESIDLCGLDLSVRFNRSHIESLRKNSGLSYEQVQNSIESFSHDLKKGLVKSKTPLNLLYGVMKKNNEYISMDQHFKPESVLFMEKQLKARTRRMNDLLQTQKQAEEASFKVWRQDLSKEQLNNAMDKMGVVNKDRLTPQFIEKNLQLFFSEHVWPDELKKLGVK